MSSTDFSSAGHRGGRCFNGAAGPCGGHWSGANIAAMVLGFIIFPPLGIAVLVWTLFGNPIQELPGWLRDKWVTLARGGGRQRNDTGDNVVFNEYQQTQYDRIQEIREEIRRRTDAFRRFRFDAKRRQDQQEFDVFMASKPDRDRAGS